MHLLGKTVDIRVLQQIQMINVRWSMAEPKGRKKRKRNRREGRRRENKLNQS